MERKLLQLVKMDEDARTTVERFMGIIRYGCNGTMPKGRALGKKQKDSVLVVRIYRGDETQLPAI